MRHQRMAILASGKGSNAEAIIKAHQAGRLSVAVATVISDRPGAPVLEKAKALGVTAVLVDPAAYGDKAAYELALAKAIEDSGATLVCLAGYMRLLGQAFLERFTGRVVNIHPSLLPAFPGLHGVRDALAAGVSLSGCTVHWVEERMDAGPIIRQAAVPVLPGDTESTLQARVHQEEHRLYPDVLEGIGRGHLILKGRTVLEAVS